MLPFQLTRCLALVLAVGVSVPGQESGRDPSDPRSEPEEQPAAESGVVLEVRALANEGFLLTAGDDVVAIDAFVGERYTIYGWLEGEALTALTTRTGPFASLDVALASHVHRDHFQGPTARAALAASPGCLLASSPQVIDALREVDEVDTIPEVAIRTALPAPGREVQLAVGDIRIRFLRLSHGTGRHADVQNLGHVITVGGVTALHVGDAAMAPANFAPYRLAERGIDVVFVPYWYFGDAAGLRIVQEHFRPARLIACHVPPEELEAVTRSLGQDHPDVLVPQETFELFRIRDEHPGDAGRADRPVER